MELLLFCLGYYIPSQSNLSENLFEACKSRFTSLTFIITWYLYLIPGTWNLIPVTCGSKAKRVVFEFYRPPFLKVFRIARLPTTLIAVFLKLILLSKLWPFSSLWMAEDTFQKNISRSDPDSSLLRVLSVNSNHCNRNKSSWRNLTLGKEAHFEILKPNT